MSDKIKAIIIEDELPAQELIKSYLSDDSEIELLDVIEDGFNGLKAINELNPDIVFLDIQIPKLTAFEMLELIENNPVIIFSTAYDEYAIKAFDNNAADYLLKPYSKSRFKDAVEKAKQKLKLPKQKPVRINELQAAKIDRIVVKTKDKIEIIKSREIFYLEADDDYIRIHSDKGEFLKNDTLKKYEDKMGKDFVRVHRSFIINVNYIENISLMAKDSYEVRMKNKEIAKVSKSGYKKLKVVLGI